MKKHVTVLLIVAMLTACSGIPISSLPRLMRLQDQLLEVDPAEFMLAIQVDNRMVPPPDAVPELVLTIRPAENGAFTPIDETLPMHFSVADSDAMGLPAPEAHRRWLLYSLTRESQTELRRIQHIFKQHRANKTNGSLSIGIAQAGVAARDPALADTRWESWLQISSQEGFFEIWSGTVAELLERADN